MPGLQTKPRQSAQHLEMVASCTDDNRNFTQVKTGRLTKIHVINLQASPQEQHHGRVTDYPFPFSRRQGLSLDNAWALLGCRESSQNLMLFAGATHPLQEHARDICIGRSCKTISTPGTEASGENTRRSLRLGERTGRNLGTAVGEEIPGKQPSTSWVEAVVAQTA